MPENCPLSLSLPLEVRHPSLGPWNVGNALLQSVHTHSHPCQVDIPNASPGHVTLRLQAPVTFLLPLRQNHRNPSERLPCFLGPSSLFHAPNKWTSCLPQVLRRLLFLPATPPADASSYFCFLPLEITFPLYQFLSDLPACVPVYVSFSAVGTMEFLSLFPRTSHSAWRPLNSQPWEFSKIWGGLRARISFCCWRGRACL